MKSLVNSLSSGLDIDLFDPQNGLRKIICLLVEMIIKYYVTIIIMRWAGEYGQVLFLFYMVLCKAHQEEEETVIHVLCHCDGLTKVRLLLLVCEKSSAS